MRRCATTSATAPRSASRVRTVDEGPNLRGTAGAVRLALDEGALEERFLLTYGDSFLPIDFAAVFRAFAASGAPALMTVFRNQGRWDTSNVIFDGRMVTLYDKQRRTRPAEDFAFIDYGLSALERRVVAEEIPAGAKADLSDLFHALSLRGQLGRLRIAGALLRDRLARRPGGFRAMARPESAQPER